MQGAPAAAHRAGGGDAAIDGSNDDIKVGVTQSVVVSLTDALPPEMLCKVVSFFRACPSQWMALLLTSRAVAAAARTVLDPASDHVRSGPNARAPTMAARLVAQYADAVPRVLDTYRCANASALLVEACRAGNIALVRTLIAERARWRVDVAYRHNRALLECVRLHSAVGVQLLLATGEVDPTDYPGAAHAGRCALHDGPACRRPDHPEPCGACARGQQHGPWSDSDTDGDDGDDGDYEAYIDMVDHSDPLADTDEDEDTAHGERDLWPRRRRAANNDDADQHADARPQSNVPHTGTIAVTAMVAPDGVDGDDDGDNHFGVDYDALFEHQVTGDNGDDHGAGVYGAVLRRRTSRRDAWSLDDDDQENDEDGDYEEHPQRGDRLTLDNGYESAGDGVDRGRDADIRGPSALRQTAHARRSVAASSPSSSRALRVAEDGPPRVDPYAHVYAEISRDGPFSDDDDNPDGGHIDGEHRLNVGSHALNTTTTTTSATVIMATEAIYRDASGDDDGDDGDDGDGDDESGDESDDGSDDNGVVDDDRNREGAASWSMNAHATTATSEAHDGAPEPTPNGHALAIRRAHLAQCICRRGMAFAIVWIDSEGREIGGRVGNRAADPLWFLVCDDPSALVADGPLSFLMHGGRARDLTPSQGAAFVSPDREAQEDTGFMRGIDADNVPAHSTTAVARPSGNSAANETDTTNDLTRSDSALGNIAGLERDAIGSIETHAAVGGVVVSIADGHGHHGDGHCPDDTADHDDVDSTHGNHHHHHLDRPHTHNDRDDHGNDGNDDNDGNDANDDDDVASRRTVDIVARLSAVGDDYSAGVQPACTCESKGRVAYSRAMERWCPLFWAALMSVGVLGQLLGHMAAEPPETRRWACRFQDVLAMAASQIIVFSSASRMEALSDVHAAALDLALTSGGIDLALHGDFLVAFAADRGCSDVVEMLVEYDAVDAGAHGDLALRRALWRYVRLYRPIQGAGARLEPEERLNRMALYGATLIALAAAIGLDTGGMEPADAHMEPIDEGFVRSLARRVYPGLTPNDIGRLRLPPLRPHYPPPFTRP
ncbi:hypothetical protein pkur_cds_142 [Pandoravirus kuranda]|uniref:Ankyrin repeat domain containing protein n=1 Tax=Pandoravirus kuranda TaxID=3019033 RepID=A0AA95ECP3_9VIRU|nr:hypothetical protein pkur_cds_142 [Pandoravirus kuranda]